MASIFGHLVASTALGKAFFPQQAASWPMLLLAGASAFLPDADVLAFRFGIAYGSQWGHRGWTHSLVFALAWGLLVTWFFYRKRKDFWPIAAWMVASTASHPLLDMLTNGGRGVALWWPFRLDRLFFPVQPIQVSPLSVSDFWGEWAREVLLSEFWWIGVPSLLLVVVVRTLSRQERG
jgi:inner membrane protein